MDRRKYWRRVDTHAASTGWYAIRKEARSSGTGNAMTKFVATRPKRKVAWNTSVLPISNDSKRLVNTRSRKNSHVVAWPDGVQSTTSIATTVVTTMAMRTKGQTDSHRGRRTRCTYRSTRRPK